jgi:uncharacterized Zn finger protein
MDRNLRPTFDRWQAALERARAEQIAVVGFRGDRAIVTASGGRGYYTTDGVRCDCPAGIAGDRICKHRAALFLWNEELSREIPDRVA